MNSYVVQPGDTLSRIAAQTLGEAGKWRLLADINGLADPNRLKVGQVLKIPAEPDEAPNTVNVGAATQPRETEEVHIHIEGKKVFAIRESDDQWIPVGSLFRKGLFRQGIHKPETFLKTAGELLAGLQLTRSEINIMVATAENEGNFDAINTWDNQYLSFGIFQWTAGGEAGRGELAALLHRVKQTFPDDFEHYWGRFGLDVVEAGAVTGRLSLDGEVLEGRERMERLRDPIWAYRFMQAGADDQVKAAQVAHAVGRLEQFYFTKSKVLGNYRLADLITSEFGVALLLDNHVNRPGYVTGCVAAAMENFGITPAELAQGSDRDEQGVLEEYLRIRVAYGKTPMTDAVQRGEVTRRYLQQGIISNRRGSFQTDRG